MKNLAEILEKHKLWLEGKEGGERADLSGADLSGANLSGADIRGAGLDKADLSGANLSKANLRAAILTGANLRRADLTGANLRGANLRGANLTGADLSGADLSGADLRGSNLPIYCRWTYSIIDKNIQIGCETRSIERWKEFLESDEVIQTQRDTEEFKQIVKVIKALIAYVEG